MWCWLVAAAETSSEELQEIGIIAAERLLVYVDATALRHPSPAHARWSIGRMKRPVRGREGTVRQQGGDRIVVVTELRLMVVVTPGSLKKAETLCKSPGAGRTTKDDF
ncbi:uncharacterized protein VDAG_01377 [Verticillium dahliae VdLs.17]|uniref:Uncharacterized protein n=1 Tax=Verticillium dahliae (strain VdLs.17 / ATCC MYA-4575 / FGSC 10137) TaxID=498257 RepID=G2WUA4_VERDV|nr:uncharacterized protein VDAG_01377 [Verticillium dahliae VdLs.17]EGY17695.1 hypothetical protein VDAG_01377 [Verticillium dahliae VdLs.17]